jgi:hypothetical protein
MVPAEQMLQATHAGALGTVLKVPSAQFEQTVSPMLVAGALT